MKEKIWLVEQESNVDGEKIFDATPCRTYEKANQVMNEKIKEILQDPYYEDAEQWLYEKDQDIKYEPESDFYWEIEKDRFYLQNTTDDYYEEVKILEKELIE